MSDTQYFELFDDMSSANRWYLEIPTGPMGEWLAASLSTGVRYTGGQPLRIEVYQEGPPLELTLTLGSVLVVNERIAELLTRMAGEDVQMIRAQVQDEVAPYFVANVLPLLKCIDEQRTAELHRWTENDGRPERVGEYRYVGGMKIDPERTEGHAILRPWGWSGVILVSDAVADELRRAKVRCQLTPVT